MPVLIWTHPEHKKVAIIATVCNFVSFIMGANSFMTVKWFTIDRPTNKQEAYVLFHGDVDCSNDVCVHSSNGKVADWQITAFWLILFGMIINSLTLSLLAFIFWPLALIRGTILNLLLVVCRTLDFFGAFLKFIAALIYIEHMHNISKNYSLWRQTMNRMSMRLASLPLAMLFVSFLFEIICVMFLIVATDEAPRTGGLTHIQRLGQAVPIPVPDVEMHEISRRVSYAPDSKESHFRVLSQIQIARASLTPNPEGTFI